MTITLCTRRYQPIVMMMSRYRDGGVTTWRTLRHVVCLAPVAGRLPTDFAEIRDQLLIIRMSW